MLELIDKLKFLFFLPPIMRGFFAMLVSGACFPMCGVMVLRLNLVPMRYMLMHGVVLGGAMALALNMPLVPVTVAVNLILIFAMMIFTKDSSFGFSGGSSATMILSMALASLIMHVADVPAKDTLSLMWGSPFALTLFDLITLCVLAFFLGAYVILNFKNILALFYNQEIARSMGVKVKFHYTVMVIVIALTVALAMKILGAFLIDALLILPVLCASAVSGKKSCGIKKIFILSSVFGFSFSILGYTVAVAANLPPASSISVFAGITFLILILWGHIKNEKIN